MQWVIWYEFRRSPLWYMTPVIVAVELVGLIAAADPGWSDAWSTASLAAAWPGFIVGALLAGTTAMTALSRTRRGESVMASTVRRRWQLEAAMLAPPIVVSIVVYALGLTAALVATWPQAHVGAGWLRPGFVLIAWSLAGIGIGVGHLTGRLIPSAWTPPLVAAGVLMLAVTLTSPDGLLFVPLVAPIEYRLSVMTVVLPVTAALVVLVTAVTAVQARVAAGGPPRVRLRYALPGAVVAVGIIAVAMSVPRLVPRTDQVTPSCTEGAGPTICLYPEAPVMYQAVQDMSDRAASLPSDRLTWPSTIRQNGLAETGDFSLAGGPWLIADQIAEVILLESGLACYSEDSPDPDAAWARYVTISEWLADRLYGGPRPGSVHTTADDLIDLPEIAAVLERSETDQRRWFDDQVAELENACGP